MQTRYTLMEKEILEGLQFLPTVLSAIIVNYWAKWQRLDGNYFQQWSLPAGSRNNPFGLTTDNEFLYISDPNPRQLYVYTLEGEYIKTWDPRNFASDLQRDSQYYPFLCDWDPRGLEIEKEIIYIMHKKMFTVINRVENKVIYQWLLPDVNEQSGLFLKIDQFEKDEKIIKKVYFTIEYSHKLYQYQVDGTIIKNYGTDVASSICGNFHYPNGVTTDEKYLYVCDYGNFRIQVLEKDNGQFVTCWGKYGLKENGDFYAPSGIYLYEDLLYVSDWYRIQVFDKKKGKWIQNIGQVLGKTGTEAGQFNIPKCFVIVNRRLYLTDWGNHRIQVFN